MNKFKQHIPNFVDTRGTVIPDYEFETTDELLDLVVVKQYIGEKFNHFALSDNWLMIIEDDGFKWWVIGSVKDTKDLDIPQWKGTKFRARMSDGTEKVLGYEEVSSSCGDILTLKDGTVATNLR